VTKVAIFGGWGEWTMPVTVCSFLFPLISMLHSDTSYSASQQFSECTSCMAGRYASSAGESLDF
jgi:hypothetical protein